MKYDPRRYTSTAPRQKVVLSHTLKAEFVGDALCKSSYLFPQPWSCIPVTHSHYGKAWSKHWMLAASHWEVMRAEHATFCMYSRASIYSEACPLRQLRGFDRMKWEGPSLPRVWYNESELATHDLRLSQISYLKQLESETVQQTALIHSYTCSELYRGWCGVGG